MHGLVNIIKEGIKMAFPVYEEVKQYEKDYKLIPICKEIYADIITPITLLRRIAELDDKFYLLESAEDGTTWGRYSFIGFQPVLRIYCKDGEVTAESGVIKTTLSGDVLDILRGYLKEYRAPKVKGMPSFCGGFVGYFSYEMISYAEPKLKLIESEFNIYDLMLFDKVIVFDHLKQKIIIIANYKTAEGEKGYHSAVLEIEKMIQLIHDTSALKSPKTVENPEFSCNTAKEEYVQMVETVKHYIKEGDIFQGVISRKFEADYEGSLLNAYRVLRTTNPSPYMYYIQCADVQIAGTSPETMVKLKDNQLITFPVAGTRKRGKDEEEDISLGKELLADEKECAEHNMLVDLARNDIGKISKYNSVEVKEYMKIHRFSKVMHIASAVSGSIREDKDMCDVITTMIPAGTLSGAPKIRACEIIEELEKTPRGIYGGAIGYLDFSGNLDVCIAIRTAVKKGNKVYVQAGAGIVADSIPEMEYEECANKALAIIEAINKAGEVGKA